MTLFRVKGLASGGAPGEIWRELQEEQVEAHSATEAMALAHRPGFVPISAVRDWTVVTWTRPRPLDVSLFTQELLSLLKAGLTLNESLETLEAKEIQPTVQQLLRQLCSSVREGRSFSQALQQHSAVFGEIYVATVQASERTGDLIPALKRYLTYRRQLDALQRKVVSAAIYPLMLILSGLGVMLFMLLYLVPRFSMVYGNLGNKHLPMASRLLLEWGQLLHTHQALVLTLLATLTSLAAWGALQPAWRARVSMYAWRVRGLGHWLRLMHLSRFYRAISMLLQSGLPLPTALRMTESLLHPALRPGLQPALATIEEGQSLSTALHREKLLTTVAERLVSAGERSGNLAEMLEHAADFHDEETSLWVERFTKVFEPILMLMIGLFIGGIVVLMYLPIFDLAGSWQQP